LIAATDVCSNGQTKGFRLAGDRRVDGGDVPRRYDVGGVRETSLPPSLNVIKLLSSQAAVRK